MLDVAAGVGVVALVLLAVGIKLVATRPLPREALVRRPFRIATGAAAIGLGAFLVWLTAFLVTTPLI